MTGQPYPHEGCCEHSFNAHSRKHCLLCACEKAPVVHQAGPPPEPDFGVDVLHECGVCHALVGPDGREGHVDWHDRQNGRAAQLIMAITQLANLSGLPVPDYLEDAP